MKQIAPNVHYLDYENVASGWEAEVLLLSDTHIDSLKCDLDLLEKHLKQAKEKNADVFIIGDLYDLMQGRYDPRRNKQDLNPAFSKAFYLDEVIDWGADFLKDYPVTFLSYGNHETSIIRNCETDPIERTVTTLDLKHGKKVTKGSYEGFIKFRFIRPDGAKCNNNYVMHYHHGYGGNAPRSKGVLSVDIDSMKYPDAQIIVRGHTHQKWYMPLERVRFTEKGGIRHETQHHIRTGSYKKKSDSFGWEVEKGFAPTTLGGVWLRFKFHNEIIHLTVTLAD